LRLDRCAYYSPEAIEILNQTLQAERVGPRHARRSRKPRPGGPRLTPEDHRTANPPGVV
jgi:hypothetical protein